MGLLIAQVLTLLHVWITYNLTYSETENALGWARETVPWFNSHQTSMRARVWISGTHALVGWPWGPIFHSSAQKVGMGIPSGKKSSQITSHISEVWNQMKDPASINNVENDHGKLLMSILPAHMQKCRDTCTYHIHMHMRKILKYHAHICMALP